MLHGEIKVNGGQVGRWTARRLVHPPQAFNDYECTLTYYDQQGYPMEAKWTLIGHHFGDGPVVLAARVLREGIPKLKRKTIEQV